MNVEQTVVANVAVFRVSGIHAPCDAGTLQAKVEWALQRGFRTVVVHLEGVTQMDAAGLGELVNINGAVRAFKGQLRLSAVPGRLRHLLAVTGLAPFFETLDSEQQAVAAVMSRTCDQETSVADEAWSSEGV